MRLVAELYYLRGLRQAEISHLLSLSNPTISRLLAQARATGIVQISVERDPNELLPLAKELSDALSVEVTLVAGRSGDAGVTARVCGVAAAPAVAELLPTEGVLGVAGGYTVSALAGALPKMERPRLTIVALEGGVPASAIPLLDVNGIAELISERLGATTVRLLAPVLVDSLKTKEALLDDSVIKRATTLWSHLDCALVGVGGPPGRRLGYPSFMDHLDAMVESRLISKGVVGEVAGHFFTIEGELVEDLMSSRMLMVDFEMLRRCPQTIIVAAGMHKVEAIVGCARTKVANRLYTDEPTAALIMKWLTAKRARSRPTTKSELPASA